MTTFDTLPPRDLPALVQRALQSRWLWCLAAVAFIGLRGLSQGYGDLLSSLGDTDDAMRLHEVRQLMAGTSWFDMALPRVGGDTPLISHWSRLIDLPLAALLAAFGLILSPANAELAVRIVWPLVVLLAFLRILVRVAETQGGARAGLLLLLGSLTCLTGLYQFNLGRIDHHNGMIAGSVGGILILLGARRTPGDGVFAGALIGVGLAIGYEPLAFLLPVLGAAALLAVVDLSWLAGVRAMAVALAATLAVIFVATVAPSLWFVARCDALSLNMVALAACGAAGLAGVDAWGRDWSVGRRVAVLATAGAIGLAIFGMLEPRCLAGPFGQVDPAVKPIWLDRVIEGFNVVAFWPYSPLGVVTFAGTMVTGLWAATERWRRVRTPEALALLVILAVAAPTGVWMIKLTPYASWVAVVAVALSLAELGETVQLTALSRQLLGVMAASQLTLTLVATPLLAWAGTSPAALNGHAAQGDGAQCMTTPAIRALAALPRGRFVGPIDFGSYIVALTDHDVLAAPYHRIDRAILLNQAVLDAEPKMVRPLLDRAHADYVVLCAPPRSAVPTRAADGHAEAGSILPPRGLQDRLQAGGTDANLNEVFLASPAPDLRVWRVVR